VTHLRKMMLEELERRNYATSTSRAYLRAVDEFARYFNRRPDQVGFPKLSLRKNPLPRHGRFGLVPNAAGLWSSSNGSAPLRFDSGLRPFPPGYSHDSIFDITASARVPAISPHVCPRCQPWGGETPEIHVPTTSRNAHRQYILPIASFLHSFRNSKYIAPGFHNGFLQVAVSKTLRRRTFLHPQSAVPPECFRYSTKTSRVGRSIHFSAIWFLWTLIAVHKSTDTLTICAGPGWDA
jgi:hypothetical protein